MVYGYNLQESSFPELAVNRWGSKTKLSSDREKLDIGE